MGHKRQLTTGGAFGSLLFVRDFAIGHIAWGVTMQFAILFPTAQVLSLNCVSDLVYSDFAFWIPGFLPQFYKFPFVLQ
jgi:hypothetical protein